MAKKLQRTVAKKRTPGAAPSGPSAPRRGGRRKGKRVGEQIINDFTIQLATLSEAGIPIVRALTILEGQTNPGPFKVVLGEFTEDVSSGTPPSESGAKHVRVFDVRYSSMVHAV